MKLNGYDLSRKWFDFCFENPEKVKPIHTALYFFAIEHCNRLGWKEKFGLPTEMTKDAIGVKSWHTYIKAFNDIVDWGFFKLYERSKNQYSSNIIALINFDEALDKALDKALTKHASKQVQSTYQSTHQSNDSIIKQYNNETIEQTNNSEFGFLNSQTIQIYIPENYKFKSEKFTNAFKAYIGWRKSDNLSIDHLTQEKFLRDILIYCKYGEQQAIDYLLTMLQGNWKTLKTPIIEIDKIYQEKKQMSDYE